MCILSITSFAAPDMLVLHASDDNWEVRVDGRLYHKTDNQSEWRLQDLPRGAHWVQLYRLTDGKLFVSRERFQQTDGGNGLTWQIPTDFAPWPPFPLWLAGWAIAGWLMF